LTFVVPILLLISTGMLSFGLAMHNSLVLTNGVNIGAQTLAISRGQTTDPCATAYSAISNAAPSLMGSLTYTFVINGTSYANKTTCAAGASNMVQGATAQITASYPCTFAIFGMSLPACSIQTETAELIQ